MIISQDKELITRLIKKYAGKSSTEAMLAFVADNNGMLSVCRLIVRKNTEDDREAMGWIDEQCYNSQVDVRDFLYVVNQILSLLQPGLDNDEYYAVLDLEVGSNEEEIKEAFRKLSRRYHPDTASAEELNASERFLEINKAYHVLLSGEIEDQRFSQPQAPNNHWKTEDLRPKVAVAKKKNIILLATLTLVMIIVSIFAARDFQKKAMISGLQRNHIAFVPPVSKSEKIEENILEIKKVEPVEPIILVEKVESEVQVGLDLYLQPVDEMAEVEINELASTLDESESRGKLASIPSEQERKSIKDTESLAGEQLNLKFSQVQQVPQVKRNDAVRNESEVSAPETKQIVKSRRLPKPVVKEDSSKKEQLAKSVALDAQREIGVGLSPEEIQLETQKRIDSFLTAYISSYESMDLLAFSRFFDLEATENGKLLRELLSTYTDLFQKATTISFNISILKWQKQMDVISVDGRFTILITYKNSNKVQGKGEISFLLMDMQQQLFIKELKYHFDKH